MKSIIKTCEVCIKPYVVIYDSLRNYCKACNNAKILKSSENISKFCFKIK